MKIIRRFFTFFKGRSRPGAEFDEICIALKFRDLGDNYTGEARYRDFRRIFLEDEVGRRVFAQIMTWCHQFRTSYVASDAPLTYLLEGERNIGLRIIAAMFEPPSVMQPKAQVEQSESEDHNA